MRDVVGAYTQDALSKPCQEKIAAIDLATRAAEPDRPDSEHLPPHFLILSNPHFSFRIVKSLMEHWRSAVARIVDPLGLHFAFCTSIRSPFWPARTP